MFLLLILNSDITSLKNVNFSVFFLKLFKALLKLLTRYCFNKVIERAKLKTSVTRLVCILFPELEKLVSTLHIASVYALLSEFPSAKLVANAYLTKLINLLSETSKGRYFKETAITFRDAARTSIGSNISTKSLVLTHTIKLI